MSTEAGPINGEPPAVEDAAGFLQGLARLRKAAGLTQSALAAKVGLSRQALSSIEAGTATPRRGVLAKLREVLAGVGADAGAPRECH